MRTPNPFTLILFFLLSQFARYPADDNEFKAKPNCPPFDCGSLGKVGYPFSNITNPECGLYDVTNCNEFLPVVHFRGGRSYDVKSFFSHNNTNTLVLHDQNPEETLSSKDCNFLNKSGLSDYYRVFKLKNRNLTLLKCPKSFSISPPPPDFEKFTTSGNFRTFNSCQDYNLYYLYPQQASLLPSIPSCSEIQLPLSEPPPEVFKDLYTLLDANIILEWLQRPVGSERDPNKNRNKTAIGVGAGLGSFILACLAFLFFYLRRRKNRHSKSGRKKKHLKNLLSDEDNPSSESSDPNMLGDNPDLKIFNFEMLLIATNYFNESTKLGRGGFGSVYKGELPDGQVVAIKRLSKSSGQGLQEFKNEVVVISKLQHRNLVRLLGCCIAGEEKILIYEYMPNNSLDTYLFDLTKRGLLDWRKRFQIIEGISRGILYLHRDSRLKVIDRDLKPSNVLLDEELNPKISDFGMARIFGSNELQANTNRVVGTYGYMSPEYAMEGQFSEKSDVFSFGVLLLEIVSGRRNSSFYNHDQSLSLLKYAWLLWNENKIESLIEPMLSEEPHCKLEIVRCIHVGLLCVQEFANDRPTMSTTLSMLTSEITALPTPKQPAFTQELPSSHSSSHEHKKFSVNTITLTSVGGR